MLQHDFSEDQVYKRMLKVAMEVWNIREHEIAAIDPLVRLLMKGLAKEMEKVGHELQTSEARIFKRLARQLMPDQLQTAVPAHAVVHFQPTESLEISRYDHFTFEKRWQNKAKFNRIENRTLNFTPGGTFPTNRGVLLYRIEQNKAFTVKSLQKNGIPGVEVSTKSNEIFLGIENISAGECYLYFDWLSEKSKKLLLNSLAKVNITSLNGKKVETNWGLSAHENQRDYFDEKLNALLKMERTVLGFYHDQFLRFSLPKESIAESKKLENSWISDVSEQLGVQDKSLTWLRLAFPSEIESKVLHEVIIQMNCFPVLNRKLCRQVFRLQPELNIRKLEFEGHFLSVERVETSQGEIYSEQDALRMNEGLKGTYSVRTGNVGRIDERDGHGYLKYLLDLIREEKQAFTSANVSSTIEDLNTVEQTIEKIEKRISFTGASGSEPYIMLTPIKNFENIYVHFWSTDGEFANGINTNNPLECKTSGLSETGQATFVTASLGGADGLMDAELIRNYKNAILTKESIVTIADIKSLCYALGGSAVSSIDVRKEITESVEHKVGLIQQLNIYVKFKNDLNDDALKDYVLKRFEAEIEAKSNFSIPLQIFVLND